MKVAKKKILFFSGSFGLGHVTRDLAIANELRKQDPNIEISWLAAHPASRVITDSGELLLPDADQLFDGSLFAEHLTRGIRLNLIKYAFGARKQWAGNVQILKKVTKEKAFDLVIGDETYEITVALKKYPDLKTFPFVMIYDFVGIDSVSRSPSEILGVYAWNRIWSKDYGDTTTHFDLGLFVGEEEDVPDKKFGFLLPNRRDYAKQKYHFIGYVFPFRIDDYQDKLKIRRKLKYGEEHLVICALGGTAIGKELMELCGQAYPIIKKDIPDLHMVLVCGPRLCVDSLRVPQEVVIKGYVPNLYEHFAASDLAVVQGGGTSTLELTALRKPFLYFPLEDHYEQQVCIARRLARHQAGIKMQYSQTTPDSLAQEVISNIDREVTYPDIPTDGAERAVRFINQLL